MTSSRRCSIGLGAAAVAVACLLAGAALAVDSASPTAAVRTLLEEVRAVLDDPALQGPENAEAREGKIRALIAARFALGAMAAEALGEHLAARTETERQEFIQLFGELFTRAYTRLVVTFLAEARTEYGAEEIRNGAASVQTEVVTRRGDRLPVAYRLERGGETWLLEDVVIDGVSIVKNYRAQFQNIIAASSYENLVKRLRTKREEVRAGSPPPR